MKLCCGFRFCTTLKFFISLQMQNQLKDEIHNVLSGKIAVRYGATIQAAASYLRNGEKAGRDGKDEKHFKRQEAKRLAHFISENNLWLDNLDFSKYVSEGAEQKVYLKDKDHVLKLNDSIYYSSWKDYLYNLLLHNYFFVDTAYDLIGFTTEGETLYAVVKQNFVPNTADTDLNEVKKFMKANGFENTRNNDYYNSELGIILEDLHDENVLTGDDILHFIDTVFYLTEDFWKKD